MYEKRPIGTEDVKKIRALLSELKQGPLGSPVRFELAAAKESDSDVLRGLGTYGFIRYPAGFIVGAVRPSPAGLVDFGYLMQSVLIALADMGLGTCWLGGTFRKSRFTDYIGVHNGEIVLAVVSLGYPADKRRPRWIGSFIQGAWGLYEVYGEFSEFYKSKSEN